MVFYRCGYCSFVQDIWFCVRQKFVPDKKFCPSKIFCRRKNILFSQWKLFFLLFNCKYWISSQGKQLLSRKFSNMSQTKVNSFWQSWIISLAIFIADSTSCTLAIFGRFLLLAASVVAPVTTACHSGAHTSSPEHKSLNFATIWSLCKKLANCHCYLKKKSYIFIKRQTFHLPFTSDVTQSVLHTCSL